MNIRSSSIVFALACLTLGGVVYSQSAGLALPGIPEAGMLASYDTLADSEIQGMDRRVSAKFENAKVDEVLKWLSDQKLSFVADTSAYQGMRVTLNFEEAKLGDVLDSIARTLDAFWERDGGVFTLRPKAVRGSGAKAAPKVNVKSRKSDDAAITIPMTGIEDTRDALDRVHEEIAGEVAKGFAWDPQAKKFRELTEKEMRAHREHMKQFGEKLRAEAGKLRAQSAKERAELYRMHGEDGQIYKVDPKTGKKVPLSDQEKKELEKKWEAWGERFGKSWESWGEKFGRQWEEWAQKWEKAQKDGKSMAIPPMPPMPPMDWKKMELDMPDMKGYYFAPGKNQRPMTQEERKAFEEAMKELGDLKIKIPEFQGEFFELKKFGKDLSPEEKRALEKELKSIPHFRFEKLDPKQLKELEALPKMRFKMLDPKDAKELESLPKGLTIPRAPDAPRLLTSANLKKLMGTLTSEQKALHKEQGWLKWSQLTDEQRKLLGVKTDGNFTISFSIDGETLTIKND